jgi:hypothetical protein
MPKNVYDLKLSPNYFVMKLHQIEGDKDNRHKVAKALLDMFELVTNDMMDDSRY